MKKETKFIIFFSIIIILLCSLIYLEAQYKPMPKKPCGTNINFTGKYKGSCFYEGCLVGCKTLEKAKNNWFKNG